jgi:hypothetical protein
MAINQVAVCARDAEAGALEPRAPNARRARHLATPVLGTYDRDEQDYARHIEYCYINPVKHGLVPRVPDWPHSSFHRDVRAGLFPEDWAGTIQAPGAFGERE